MSEQKIDGALGFLLNKGTQVLHRELNRGFIAKGFDITTEQWSILIFLFHCDSKSQNEIAEKTFRDKVSVTKIIDNLEKRGLVYRIADNNDRRIKRIVLTREGKLLTPQLKKIALSILNKAFENISNEDLESFKFILSQIVKNFTGEDLLSFININKGRWK